MRASQAALQDATATAREPVLLYLRNAVTSLMAETGYGQGYRYVHDDPLARDQMPARPPGLEGRVYFES